MLRYKVLRLLQQAAFLTLQVFCHEKHYLVQAACRSIEAKNKKQTDNS
jgi:hypothetical protein